jgi:energy-coupling factor transporter ATP-binding protein EcfA2
MFVKAVNIPRAYPQDNGLSDVQMDRLGPLVLLAGRNGSGKSRLLVKIARLIEDKSPPDSINRTHEQLSRARKELAKLEEKLRKLTDYNSSKGNRGKRYVERESECKEEIASARSDIAELEADIKRDEYLELEGETEPRNVLHFLPKNVSLSDPRQISPNQLMKGATECHTIGIDNIETNVLLKIQYLHDQYWRSTHPSTILSQKAKESISREHERLQKTIELLLKAPLGTDDENNATLFGFPIGSAKLSEGQKILLQLAVALHCQEGELSNCILLLDEPENHVHPGAIIEVIETLSKAVSNGQIWVATHSVPILAHFSEEASVWYMDEGNVSFAGKIQEKVLQSLLGNEKRIERQREFLEKPEIVALNRYAKQCLCPPPVLMTGPNDPQVRQIRKVVNRLYKSYEYPKILDFGAGKGRLIANLHEDSNSTINISSKVDYVAFDHSVTDQDECLANISKVYSNSEDRWFCKYYKLIEHYNKKSFNLVVMCNVLHEILPNDWANYFGQDGKITNLLKEDGYLLVVEDHRIPVGENAHEFGFIVLDTPALKDLFGIEGKDDPIIYDCEREGRLKAHLIPENFLKRVNRSTIEKALQTHSDHAVEEIKSIRRTGDPDNGRLHAFWLLQYANVMLCLSSENVGD